LETIYEEAWQDEDSPLSDATALTLREDFESFDELRKAIPELILRWNLYGIDIDPRAVQIAALALWLRTQRLWQTKEVRSAERPRLTKSNIVCAEPMPGDDNMLKEFVNGLQPKVLSQLVEVVFEKMKLAGEAGSLLKIEEEIKDAVAEARKQWEAKPKPEQARLFPEIDSSKYKQQELRFDVSDIDDVKFWDRVEALILQSLQEYAERAENGLGDRRRMFAEDAAQGFAFIDLCRKRFDVVLMNPPFGESAEKAFEYVDRNIPYWCKNLASAFVGRIISALHAYSKVGMVTDRTILIKSSYEDFRINYALTDLSIGPLADLGWEVLDANVEVSAVIFSKSEIDATEELFVDCRNDNQKDAALLEIIRSDGFSMKQTWLKSDSFSKLPNAAIAYDMPGFVIRWFNLYPALRESGAKALQGHAIKMDWYGRLQWEVDPSYIGPRSLWTNMYNGGPFSRFYLPLIEIVRWNNDGIFLKHHPSTRWSNSEHQQKPGIGYGKRGDILDAHIVPVGHVFTVEGLFILPDSVNDVWYYLGILNSPLCTLILNYYCGQHKHAGYLDLLPIPFPDSNDKNKKAVSKFAHQSWMLKRDFDKQNEVSPLFICPWLSTLSGEDSFFEIMSNNFVSAEVKLAELTKSLEKAVEKIYQLKADEYDQIADSIERLLNESVKLSEKDIQQMKTAKLMESAGDILSYSLGVAFGRWDIRYATDGKEFPKLPGHFDPLPACPPGMLQNAEEMPVDKKDLPSDYPLSINWDGILVDDEGHQQDIVTRVREAIEIIWKDKYVGIEQEACKILKLNSLRDYFGNPTKFFGNVQKCLHSLKID
jgi:uncharacterized protein YdcH (DUF465 family)